LPKDSPIPQPYLARAATRIAEPWLEPYTIVERETEGETVKVGVLGMVTPWVSVWDKHHVEGWHCRAWAQR